MNENSDEIIKVEAQDFLDPCKSIATMQIAREIRNDTAARLWNALQTIPKEMEDYATKLRKQNENNNDNNDESPELDPEIDIAKLPHLDDQVLDLDIVEALNEVKQFRDVVLRQRQARKRCIDLLIKSRCQFGSMDAAQAFEDFGAKLRNVKKRRLLLSDAMELEGLDFVEDGGDGYDEEVEGG